MTLGRRHAVVLVSGASLALAFPAPDLAPLAWICVAPLLWAVGEPAAGEHRVRRGAALGFVFGIGFFGALLTWITLIGYVAYVLLVLLQAAFLAGFGAVWAGLAARLPARARPVAAPALWVAFEFLRSVVPLGGFTWGQLAQSQHDLTWMLRPAAFGGGWAVAFMVVAVNAALVNAVVQPRRRLAWAASTAALVAAPLLLPANDATGPGLRVAIVQGNVPRAIPRGLEREQAIIASHVALTQELAGRDVDLVVWPESSLGLDPERFPEAADGLRAAAQAAGAPMIVGGNLDLHDDRYIVAAFLVDETGTITERYQKTHLVPFGEYVPGRRFLGWIPMLDQVPRDAVPGDEPAVFEVAGGRVAPVISFEGDFGSLVRRPIDAGGRLLVVATNTSTWGETWASAQHVAFSQVRAAENGVWTLHGALSGISAVIAPDGSLVEETELWTATTLVADVAFAEDASFYARTGDWLPWLCILGAVASVVVLRRRVTVTP